MSFPAVRTLLAWVAVALVCQASVCQTNSDWASVQGISPGTTISVKTKSGVKYHGEFISASKAKLDLDANEPAFPGRTIRRRELARDEVREVRFLQPVKSVLAGAGIGASIGIGLGAGIESTAKSKEDNGILPVVFGLLGLAIGAGIAKSHPFVKGKKIYASP